VHATLLGAIAPLRRCVSKRRPGPVVAATSILPTIDLFGGLEAAGASPKVSFPSAFAGHVALSGAASLRTIPLRRCDMGRIEDDERLFVFAYLQPPAARPCGIPPCAAPGVPEPSSFAIAHLDGNALASAPLVPPVTSGHASPYRDLKAMFRYLIIG